MSVESRLLAQDYSSSSADVRLRSVLGALLAMDWRDAMIARGYGWRFDVGTFSTPIVGGGNGTVLDADQPEFVIDIPTGSCCVVHRIDIACQAPLLAADSEEIEIVVEVDSAAVSGATSTQGTVETVRNMRTNKTTGCPFSVVSAVTTNTSAAPTVTHELGHRVKVADLQGIATSAMWTDLFYRYGREDGPFFICGPASIWGYWGGTVATSGFASVELLGFDTSLISSLS